MAKADLEKLIEYSRQYKVVDRKRGMKYDTGSSSMVYTGGMFF